MTMISYSKRFIYIRPRKTATSTTEFVLRNYISSPKDICSYEPQFKNYYFNNGKYILNLRNLFENIKIFLFNLKKNYYSIICREFDDPHMPAREIIKRIGLKNFRQYFIVSSIRNPYDMMISAVRQKYSKNSNINKDKLNEIIQNKAKIFFELNKVYFDKNNRNVVNFFIRVEKLDHDLNHFCKKILNVEDKHIKIPFLNKSKNKKFKIKDLSKENIRLINNYADYIFKLGKYKKIN